MLSGGHCWYAVDAHLAGDMSCNLCKKLEECFPVTEAGRSSYFSHKLIVFVKNNMTVPLRLHRKRGLYMGLWATISRGSSCIVKPFHDTITWDVCSVEEFH